jgi:hypothetical protein
MILIASPTHMECVWMLGRFSNRLDHSSQVQLTVGRGELTDEEDEVPVA